MPTGPFAHAPFYTVIALGALLLEAGFGYPARLFRAIGHPVMWLGWVITRFDHALNDERRSDCGRLWAGAGAALALCILAGGAAALLQAALLRLLPSLIALPLLATMTSALLAQRSLHRYVAAVAEELSRDGLAGGRRAVAHIVGRNPQSLDEPGVLRAAIESLAENFSDGVVAPALWCCIAGLPGIVLYKVLNTSDSMIGHRTSRHAAFGWASARLDDLVNLPASRLAACWLVVAACLRPGCAPKAAWRAAWRDARRHRSPNAGWPEAAMAGALGLRLAGPRVYGSTRVEDAWMGNGRAEATQNDLHRALALYRVACALQVVALATVAVLIAQG